MATESLPPNFREHPIIEFMQSELDCHNYNDILEFEQQLNSLYFENIQVLKSFSKLKNNQVNEAKKFLLDHTL